MRITHIALWSQENVLSEKFYKKLGFKTVRSGDDMSVVALQDFEIWLINMRDDELFANDALTSSKGKGMYIYISVADVDETYARFIRNRISVATQPRDWPWGNREFIVKDPDGYKLCFWQVIPK